jgi:putative DNA primase/helicase
MMPEPLQERARGRWYGILPAIGIDRRFLVKKHGPCPMCGGKDRWRFTDIDGLGTFYCNNCKGGSGVGLVMLFTGLPFMEAARRIERVIGESPAQAAKPIRSERSEGANRDALNALWRSSRPVRMDDPVDRWLNGRGVGMTAYPTCLRFGPRVRYSGPPVSWHPAMLAMVTDSSGGKPVQIHRTYLTIDGLKAPVEKARMMCAGSLPASWAVRLTAPGPVMGIAEGLETAIAAMQMTGIPTWSALNAGGIEKFEPPPECQRLIVFGDNDRNCVGQRAAYALAARLSGRIEVEVRIPETPDSDWNDTLLGRGLG